MITTQTELDVSPGSIAPVIHVSQYDTGSRTLLFNLIATAGDLILPTGTKAEIRGTKPDGNGFSYDALINGKTVTADVTEQMTAAAGKRRKASITCSPFWPATGRSRSRSPCSSTTPG